jgi:hypothetical protein
MASENDDLHAIQYVASKNKYKAFDAWLKANGSSAQSVLSGNLPQTGGATLMQGTYCLFYNREVLANNLKLMKEKDPKLGKYDFLNNTYTTGGGIFDSIKSKATAAAKSVASAAKSSMTKFESSIKGTDKAPFPSVTQIKGLVGSSAYVVKNGESTARTLFRVGALLKIFKFIETAAKPLYNSIIKVLVKMTKKTEAQIKEKLSGKIPDDILDVNLSKSINLTNPANVTKEILEHAVNEINIKLQQKGSPLVDAVFIITINRMTTNHFHNKILFETAPSLTAEQLNMQPGALQSEIAGVPTSITDGIKKLDAQTGGALFVMAEAEFDKLEASTSKSGFVQFKYEQMGGGDDEFDFLSGLFYYIFVYPLVQVFYVIIIDRVVDPIVKATTGMTHSTDAIVRAGGMRTISLNRVMSL